MSKYLIAIDDGHGMETAGRRTPPIPSLDNRVVRENEFNSAVKRFVEEELKRCGFKVLVVAPGDKDIPLKTRTDLANKKNADAYISIHYNAFDGKFKDNGPEGHSLHIYPGSAQGRKLAEYILKYLRQGIPQKNRGIIENNFHVLRETKMPAVLSENGFMDNKREALLMINIDFQKEVAKEHAQGICDYFGVKYISQLVDTPSRDDLWTVQTGAFKHEKNAKELLKELEKDSYKAQTVKLDNLYKVQVGAYAKKTDARTLAKKIKNIGYNTFVTNKRDSSPVKKPKDVTNKLAEEVIKGQWGNGEERRKRLEQAGYNYQGVQKRVNQLLLVKSSSGSKKDIRWK